MAATSTPPPFSLLPPSTYGPNPLGPFSFSFTFPSHHGTTTRHRPPVVLDPMGLKDKVPALIRRSSTSKPLPEATDRGSLPAVEKIDSVNSPRLSCRFLSGSLRRSKKKRSISSLFQVVSGDVQPIVLDSIPTPHSDTDLFSAPVPPVEKKTVSVVLEEEVTSESQEEVKVDGFQRKNHFLTKSGMKHHPYPEDAPYMQAYDPILLDNDRFTDTLLRRLNSNGSSTFHDYGIKPPSNVLDLGCGNGRWVVEAATTWRSFGTKVTGFDLVNVTGHSWEVDETTFNNITWVQGNFLKYQLPFPDRSFDLVRMANLSLAIPHHKWLPIFTEVRRVLAPGGRLELIDDQIFFPYNENSVPSPAHTHNRRPSASSFDSDSDSDSDYDTDQTQASSTLVNHSTFLERVGGPSPAQEALADWQAHATNSKGLETIFENMLLQKHGIHSRPQDIVDVMLAHVFGSQHADRVKTMHVALAPADHVEAEKMTERSDVDVGLKMGQSSEGKSDDEITMAIDEMQKQAQDEPSTPERPSHTMIFEPSIISPKAALLLGINPTEQISGEIDHLIQVAEKTNRRTVGRLKINPSMIWKEKWSGMKRSKRPSMESLRSEFPEFISPKAAERLGIVQGKRLSCGSRYSQSSLSEIDLHGDRARGDSVAPDVISPKAASRVVVTPSLGTTQPPGLILWPSTFIPMEPLELEMHACKNMHVLLGCKAALWDFIQDVKGEDGRAHISQDEFNELAWEYECFRRKRFNWPAEILKSRLPIPASATIQRSPTVRSATSSEPSFFKRPGSSSGSPNSLTSPNLASNYKREELTFVRVFRVYEAYRVDEPGSKLSN